MSGLVAAVAPVKRQLVVIMIFGLDECMEPTFWGRLLSAGK